MQIQILEMKQMQIQILEMEQAVPRTGHSRIRQVSAGTGDLFTTRLNPFWCGGLET